ncbi:putative rad4 beta-hairpin domain 2 [Lyophyllum shimeji]|uniref:Rad4 beta-hairpin domain 2 n=1 Tax=Lyophyllum shimeji TaxID=47721 RepID=A0A9P3UMT4_LYOSH|nr:putative rad4 beta-hairpin domain 2 [Lyophyllum shimeji]
MASISENDPFTEQDSEDDFDWEEVQVPEHEPQQEQEHIEITIPAPGPRRKKDTAVNKFKGISHAERLKRIDCHKIHTVALLGNASVRNKWINDPLLHARLLSITPLSLQNAFAMIHKSRVPDQHQRGRMFETAIANLVEWWSNTYFEVTPDGHLRNRTYDEVQAKLAKLNPPSGEGSALSIEDFEDLFDEEPEVIRSPKSLMKHALMRNGSRDVSAQLFTALCRGLGIPARLVVSLQSVPWQTNVGKPKPTYIKKPKGDKGKGKAKETDEDAEENGDLGSEDVNDSGSTSRAASEVLDRGKGKAFPGEGLRLDGSPVPKNEKAKGKEKAKPVITLRKSKSKGHVLGSAPGPSRASSSKLASPDPTITPPVFWTEVFSRPDARWIPVDPIRSIVNKRKVFDPTPTTSAPAPAAHSALFPPAYAAALARSRTPTPVNTRATRQENRLLYVMAFEEDGYARDVTRRYAREFSAKIAKEQGGSSTIGGGKGRQAWWERVVGLVSRPYRLHRDDVEDEELETAQMMEGMPTTIAGFKDHPIYVLTRHLKQNQVIHPPPPDTPELGKFRGQSVYPRSAVVSLKTAENWMRREGRTVKAGEQPLKMVKIRTGTINRMRELEVLKDGLREAGDSGASVEETMQGLYARSQTEVYQPGPVVNGIVPKNNFGNVDLYVPSMLPRGAVHVPFKGVAKIAKKLGFDFAEAVVGFEFKKRRAFPVLEGVVVAQEHEAALLEAYWEAEHDAQEKARAKREERVIKQWTRLIQGLRIRRRLQAQYATKPDGEQHSQDSLPKKRNDIEEAGTSKDIIVTMSHPGVNTGGGFLVGADDVVQPFHLPKAKYQPFPESSSTPAGKSASLSSVPRGDLDVPTRSHPDLEPSTVPEVNAVTQELATMDVDTDGELEEVPITRPHSTDRSEPSVVPKTMRELAEDAARQERLRNEDVAGSDGDNAQESDIYQPSRRPIRSLELAESGIPKIKISPRPYRVNLKLSGNTATTDNTLAVGPVDVTTTSTTKQRKVATQRRASARGKAKKRMRDDDSEDDTSGEDVSAPTPKKRAASSAKAITTPAPSTRTLRPRAPKTPAQLKEAEEQEEAYRRAVTL